MEISRRHFVVEMQWLVSASGEFSRRSPLQFLLLSKKVPRKYFYYAKEKSSQQKRGSLLVLNKSSYHRDIFVALTLKKCTFVG